MGKDSLVWMIDYANNYQFDREGNCFNIKTGKQLKRVLQKYTEGYCIQSKFKSLKQISKYLVKINDVNFPF